MVLKTVMEHCINTTETNTFIVHIQGIPAAVLILQHRNSSRSITDSVSGLSKMPSERNKREFRILVSPLREARSSTVRAGKQGCCGSASQRSTETRGLGPLGTHQFSNVTHRRGSESLGFSLNVRRTIQKRVYFSVNLSKQLNYVEILYNLFEWHDGTNPLKTYLVLLRCDEVPMA